MAVVDKVVLVLEPDNMPNMRMTSVQGVYSGIDIYGEEIFL